MTRPFYSQFNNPAAAHEDDELHIAAIRVLGRALEDISVHTPGYAALVSGLAENIRSHAMNIEHPGARAAVVEFCDCLNYDDLRSPKTRPDMDGLLADTIEVAETLIDEGEDWNPPRRPKAAVVYAEAAE